MNLLQAASALFFFAMLVAGEAAWAKGGSGSHGHHHHHSRSPVLYPYAYPPASAYANRYRINCAKTPELEECVRERERLIYPQAGNASG